MTAPTPDREPSEAAKRMMFYAELAQIARGQTPTPPQPASDERRCPNTLNHPPHVLTTFPPIFCDGNPAPAPSAVPERPDSGLPACRFCGTPMAYKDPCPLCLLRDACENAHIDISAAPVLLSHIIGRGVALVNVRVEP